MKRAKPLGAIAGLAAAALLATCGRDIETAPAIENVEEPPGLPYGETVTLRGAIEATHGPRALVLAGDDLWAEEEVAVIAPAPLALAGAPLARGDEVVVTGRLERALTSDIARDLDWELDPLLAHALGSRPVLIADRLRALHEHARWSATDNPEGALVGMTPLVTAADPATLEGRPLFLDAVVVQETAGEGLWIGHGPTRSLFVVPEEGTSVPPLARGDRIDVVGILRATPDATELSGGWKLSGARLRQVAERPLYLDATSIAPASDDGSSQSAVTTPPSPS